MDVKEKLVELLEKTPGIGWSPSAREIIADHLIVNGVTIATDNNVGSKWISVKDRLPTFYDADEDNCVLAIHKASNKRYYHWRSVADNPFDFMHWMKTPQPPKGE